MAAATALPSSTLAAIGIPPMEPFVLPREGGPGYPPLAVVARDRPPLTVVSTYALTGAGLTR
jgi:hypothetical protein